MTDREPLFLISMSEDETPEEMAERVAQRLRAKGIEVVDDDEPPTTD